jgi:hypothetical protein
VSDLATHDIIVIGASAGGISAVKKVICGLPADLPAALFVVIHVPPRPSNLAEVLSKSSRLPTLEAIQDQPIQRGTIYVAPPDHHLFIDNDRILLWQGLKRESAAARNQCLVPLSGRRLWRTSSWSYPDRHHAGWNHRSLVDQEIRRYRRGARSIRSGV